MKNQDRVLSLVLIVSLALTSAVSAGESTTQEARKKRTQENASVWKKATGRFAWPKEAQPRDFQHYHCAMVMRTDKPLMYKHGDGLLLNVASDGSFEVSNLAPGPYFLFFDVFATAQDKKNYYDRSFRQVRKLLARYGTDNVVVPHTSGSSSWDLGEFELTLFPTPPGVGDLVPDIELPLLGNSVEKLILEKRVKLSDYRGKVVLLDFGFSSCPGCQRKVPDLKAIWKRFENNDRFTMLRVSLSFAPEKEITDYIQKHNIPWQCALMPAEIIRHYPTGMGGPYGVDEYPSIWVIGPDGKVLARDLSGKENIIAAVEEAVKSLEN